MGRIDDPDTIKATMNFGIGKIPDGIMQRAKQDGMPSLPPHHDVDRIVKRAIDSVIAASRKTPGWEGIVTEVEEAGQELAGKLHAWDSMVALLESVARTEDCGVHLLTMRRLVKEHSEAVAALRRLKAAGTDVGPGALELLRRLDGQEER